MAEKDNVRPADQADGRATGRLDDRLATVPDIFTGFPVISDLLSFSRSLFFCLPKKIVDKRASLLYFWIDIIIF